MNIVDIIQLVILCAILFIPAGYLLALTRNAFMNKMRALFIRPKLIRPAGTLHRPGKEKDNQNDA